VDLPAYRAAVEKLDWEAVKADIRKTLTTSQVGTQCCLSRHEPGHGGEKAFGETVWLNAGGMTVLMN
jgi:hypothetical protein